MDKLNIISLGAGVQSSTLALMAACGEISPMPNCAIFADTQAEPKEVYEWLDWLEKQLPFPVYRVTKGSLEEYILTPKVHQTTGKPYYRTVIPFFVKTKTGDNSTPLRRHCTRDFKIRPIISQQRKLLGDSLRAWRKHHSFALKAVAHAKRMKRMIPIESWNELQNDALVHNWIGISLDESLRMKPSREPWIKNIYPLVDRNITRERCLEWMRRKNFPTPPKSACVWCPYHDDAMWATMKQNHPEQFQEAVEFEKRVQSVATGRLVNHLFLHRSLKPLSEVDFSDALKEKPKSKQLDMFNNECSGLCGV